jgi:hypothetical protein
MHSIRPEGTAPSRSCRARLGFALALVLPVAGAVLGASACLERPLCTEDCRPRTTNIFVETVDQTAVDKIDLLFMIDNSASMADKQVVLSQAVPDLVRRLVSPNCVTPDGILGDPRPGAACDAGFSREFQPIEDIHIGIITSSLGGHGGDSCKGLDGGTVQQEEDDDHAHLVAKRPRGKVFAPASPEGFLDWNPTKTPGQKVDDVTATFASMTTAAGEDGCGYEAQLESVYRFLVDPSPPQAVTKGTCSNGQPCAVLSGRDDEILTERAAFLRPDSLVAVILLTDENDCSIRDGGQAYYVTEGRVQAGSSVCATNPNDKCCYSCGAPKPPDGCAPDPKCTSAPASPDEPNLRCYHQKQRFGFDFLYPVERYVNALTKPALCTSRPDLDATDPSRCFDADKDQKPDVVENPLFKGGRAPDLVFFAGIIGVPWQDIQATKDNDGKPYSARRMNDELHYKTAADLEADKVWDTILGQPDPGNGAPPILPTDGLMVESTFPRPGVDGQGHPIVGPGAGPMANPVNGHDWNISAQDDLEYACIFQLPVDFRAKHPCAVGEQCDCSKGTGGDNNPLCQDPVTGAYGTDQLFAKAYPGIRELQVLRGVGDNAIVASICARNLGQAASSDASTPSAAQDYGYRPAVEAIVDRLKSKLVGRCLPRALEKDPTGHYPCSIIEATPVAGAVCDKSRGRLPPNLRVIAPALERLRAAGFCDAEGRMPCAELSLCELQEAGDECHRDQTDQPIPGWCYVDPAANPGKDDPSLVEKCSASMRRTLRFVDPKNATPATGARVVIACIGADFGADDTPALSSPASSAAQTAPAVSDAGRP